MAAMAPLGGGFSKPCRSRRRSSEADYGQPQAPAVSQAAPAMVDGADRMSLLPVVDEASLALPVGDPAHRSGKVAAHDGKMPSSARSSYRPRASHAARRSIGDFSARSLWPSLPGPRRCGRAGDYRYRSGFCELHHGREASEWPAHLGWPTTERPCWRAVRPGRTGSAGGNLPWCALFCAATSTSSWPHADRPPPPPTRFRSAGIGRRRHVREHVGNTLIPAGLSGQTVSWSPQSGPERIGPPPATLVSSNPKARHQCRTVPYLNIW